LREQVSIEALFMRTLVLNAGYEPLAVVTFRRALVLVLTGKASVVAEDDDPVVGPTEVLGRPSVILLNRYVKVPYRHDVTATRRGVLRRDNHLCAYCGKTASTIDHVQPRSKGGADTWENLVACCLKCNNAKGDKTLSSLGWKLRVVPLPPRGPQWQIRELEKPAPQWSEFLAENAA
jgi:5-methylcytosine-specific restriction endonuclease McrA